MENQQKQNQLIVSACSQVVEFNQNESRVHLNKNLINLFANHVNSRFDDVHLHIEQSKFQILEKLEKKTKKKSTSLKCLERDAIDFHFYEKILKTKREKREKILHYSRFRVASTLLFLTGARVNEIRNLSHREVYDLLKDHILILNQSKTKSLRKIVLGNKALSHLKSLEKDIDTVFLAHETLSGGQTEISWIKFINKRLKKFALLYKKNSTITSHSFRIGFVTKLLEKLPIHLVKDLVDHKSIDRTMKYSRYRLSDSEKANALDQLLE